MNKVKLSSLNNEDILFFETDGVIVTKEEVLKDLDYYKSGETLYTTTEYKAGFNAEDIIRGAIENEYDNMYEDWDEVIGSDISDDDIKEFQEILDRILERNPSQNIAYPIKDIVEIDID